MNVLCCRCFFYFFTRVRRNPFTRKAKKKKPYCIAVRGVWVESPRCRSFKRVIKDGEKRKTRKKNRYDTLRCSRVVYLVENNNIC